MFYAMKIIFRFDGKITSLKNRSRKKGLFRDLKVREPWHAAREKISGSFIVMRCRGLA